MSDAEIATLLFTDLVRSTELYERLGDEAGERVRYGHFSLLREAVRARGGREVKSLGDGLMAVFDSTVEALGCAVAIQEAVARHSEEHDSPPLQVRVGLHVGEVIRDEGDYFGTPVVVAERLCGAASGGQILASELVRRMVGSRGGHGFQPVGPLHLSGLSDPLTAWAVEWQRPPAPPAGLPEALAGERRPFVGRTDELKLLRGAWAVVEAGRRQLLLLTGDPGIGKTRLAAELARQVAEEGATVLYGRCDEDGVVPYQPFVEALRHMSAGDPGWALPTPGQRAELARLVPELAEAPSPPPEMSSGDPETDRYRFFEAVASLLGAASRRHPVLLVLDDLHWATKPTLLLLRHLVHASEASVLLLGIYREVELTRTHPLTDVLAALRRDGLYERIHLRGLSPVEVTALLELRAGHELEPDALVFSDALAQETAGNPFFIVEILRHLAETGGIGVQEGRWVNRAGSLDALDIPEGVRDVIGRRLSRLSGAANAALSHAAVLGREFEFDVLSAMAGLDDDTLLTALDEALGAHLVAEVAGTAVPTYGFTHALVREALVQELSRARVGRMHLRAARAIETIHAGHTDARAGTLALHYRQALWPGEPDKAIEYSIKAGQAAARALAWEEVASHWQAALELMNEQEHDPRQRALLLESLAMLMYVAGFDLAQGIAYSEKALALYEELEEVERAGRMHSRLGHYLTTFPEMMDVPRALRHFQAAQAIMERGEESQALGYVFVGLGAAGWWGMRSGEGLAAASRAREIGESQGHEALQASGAGGQGWHLAARGSLAEGREQVERAWATGDRLNHRFLGFYAAWGRGVLSLLTLDPEEAVTWFERELGRPRLAQAPMQRRLLGGELASARLLSGQLAEARGLPVANGLTVFVPPLSFFAGEWETAEEELRSARKQADEAGNRWHQWSHDRALAQVCRLRGDPDQAEWLLQQALTLALEAPYGVVEAWLRTDLALVRLEQGNPDDARGHLERGRDLLDPPEDWRGLSGRLALGEATLAAAEGRLEESEARFREAVDVFRRYHLPWEEAEAHLLAGSALRRAGQLEEAAERFAAAAETYRRVDAARPWLERMPR
jgi:class 3 adenylate cyclase/tetratricopeptide (TPR) repeat protein